MSDPVRILLVEDNPAHARLVRQALLDSSAGEPAAWFQLRVAERLSEGLQALAQGGVDVVLLDLSLPDSAGLDTLTSVSGKAPGLPIVVMTGLEDESVAVRALQAGAEDYLIKGQAEGGLLARAIRYAIERKRIQVALLESEKQLRLLNESLEHKVRERTAEVRLLASDLTKAEQRERRRISHILHDDLQQRLYAIKIQTALLVESLGAKVTVRMFKRVMLCPTLRAMARKLVTAAAIGLAVIPICEAMEETAIGRSGRIPVL